jgi:hypothetical protein
MKLHICYAYTFEFGHMHTPMNYGMELINMSIISKRFSVESFIYLFIYFVSAHVTVHAYVSVCVSDKNN